MGASLLIVITFIYNRCSIYPPHKLAQAGAAAHDPRYDTLLAIAELLEARGHRVLAVPIDRPYQLNEYPRVVAAINRFGYYSPDHERRPDLFIKWFGARAERLEPWRSRFENVPTLVFENGVFKDSVIVDPKGLLGDSFYAASLEGRVQEGFDEGKCRAKLESMRSTSKRPQSPSIDIPEEIRGNYIFVPTQKFLDLSVTKYSSVSMPELLENVAKYCTLSSTPMVVKIHPHLEGVELGQQKAYVAKLQSTYKNIYLSHASITFLTQHALATATLNGGTLVDNFNSQTPVVSYARSLFSNSTALVYDTSVERGLTRLSSQHLPWSAARKLRQQQVVCWLHDMSLFSSKTPEANLETLQRHIDALLEGEVKELDILDQADSDTRLPKPEIDDKHLVEVIKRPAHTKLCLQ